MDPVEGPLEPPHHVVDSSKAPFIIRSNAPVPAGTFWIGLAELTKHKSRIELTAWREHEHELMEGATAALAVILTEPLPMTFPRKGKDFFRELAKQGIDREWLLKVLGMAARYGDAGDPVYLILGMPSRRGPDGSSRHHFAVWGATFRENLPHMLPRSSDSEDVAQIRRDIGDIIFGHFEETDLTWCPVFEDRSEIVIRRDIGRPMAWFEEKRILLLGCGALGSWAGELIARARPALLHLVDNGRVKPGLLVRQNFTLDDIGSAKAVALASRIKTISGVDVQCFVEEAHNFLTADPDRAGSYDLVLDCTASSILQMKLDRDWGRFQGKVQRMASLIIDSQAEYGLVLDLGRQPVHGPWVGYVRLKQALCEQHGDHAAIDAFYSDRAVRDLFQPEPGCSDPTFSGSAADVTTLTSATLNLIARNVRDGGTASGFTLSAHDTASSSLGTEVFQLVEIQVIVLNGYRVYVRPEVLTAARSHVLENNHLRSALHETGGLLWGYWDDAARIIIISAASGPPPDSRHDPAHFVCGTEGTAEEHTERQTRSRGASGFLGLWHTHPGMAPKQSLEDIRGMADLVSGVGQNQRRALMLIFGRYRGQAEAGVYMYESQETGQEELVSVGTAMIKLNQRVV
jgi:hypothetical protein